MLQQCREFSMLNVLSAKLCSGAVIPLVLLVLIKHLVMSQTKYKAEVKCEDVCQWSCREESQGCFTELESLASCRKLI